MFRIALKNVLARKGRLLLSSLAVIAGCTFLSGVFVFSDTIRASIDEVFATQFENTDAYVRSAVSIESDFGGDAARGKVSDSLIDQIKAVPGVSEVEGGIQSFARISTEDGKEIGFDGPPKYGGIFNDSDLSPWDIDEGAAPVGPDQVVIDKKSAEEGSVSVGDTVTITTVAGARPFTVVGIVTFNGRDSTGGPTWALFDQATAEEFVLGQPGMLDSISVRGDGTRTEAELQADIQALFPADEIEVLTGQQIIDESQSDLAEQFGLFTTFLTVFAGIALFVGSFIIYNVFKISAAQRLRENALMRAIGARSSQVTTALFVEAAVVGLVGGILGFLGGVALATGISALLSSIGLGTGGTSLVIKPASVVITILVGLIVTLICATFPAIRAGRVPPLAAMRDVSVDRSHSSGRRLIVGAVAGVIAIVGIVLGLTGDAVWLAPGIAGLFVSLIAFGPAVVGPLAGLLTKPLGFVRGVTGEVAGRNAARSPERTALTAAALAIGLALLVAVSVLGSSITDSFRKTIGETFVGDFAVTPADQGNGGFPASLADELNTLPEVENAVGFGLGPFQIVKTDGTTKDAGAFIVDPPRAAQLLELHFTSGGWEDVQGNGIIVQEDTADSQDLQVGDTFEARFLDQSTDTLTVAGIYDDDFFGNYIADRTVFENRGLPLIDLQIVAQSAPGVPESEVKSAIESVTKAYPTAQVQTRNEYIDSNIEQINGLLNFIYALLGMSVFIAVLGIVLTLLLAVYERRRELGLMRAIGTTRPQIRGSIRWEAVVTALLGAIMGTALGLALGWIVVRALKDQGLNTFTVAPMTLVIFAVLSVVLAVIAAWIPARRAAKAEILQAIATT